MPKKWKEGSSVKYRRSLSIRDLNELMLRKPALRKLPSPVPPTVAEASHDARADSLACAASCLSLALLFKFLFGGCCFEADWHAVRITCKSAAVTKTCTRSLPLRLTTNLPPACQIYLKPSPCAIINKAQDNKYLTIWHAGSRVRVQMGRTRPMAQALLLHLT